MIVGLNGFKSAGKNVVGEYLAEQYGFELASFAALLKRSAAALFEINPELWDKLKNEDNARITLSFPYTVENEKKLTSRSVTVRTFLQRYGTESHREVFGYDFWVEQAFKTLDFYEPVGGTLPKYVFTDARFENELIAIREKGGKNIQIFRPETDGESGGHASEVRPNDELIDAVIYNTGTLDNLYDSADRVIGNLYPEISQ